MEGDDGLYLQLRKLPVITTEESLDEILTTLWRTRRTGIRSPEESRFRSLLNLSSTAKVEPVLACLRSLIRRCTDEDFTSEDLLKLFPPDLSLNLKDMLVKILQRHKSLWKEEMSKEQHLLPRTTVSYQVKTNVPPTFTSFPSSQNSTLLLAPQDGPIARFNPCDLVVPTSTINDGQGSHMCPQPIQLYASPADNLRILPHFKSMTWNVENPTARPANRVAIVTLKLQDQAYSPSEDIEVKFKLSRDTIESMLKSVSKISEKLSSAAGTSSGSVQKKQKL